MVNDQRVPVALLIVDDNPRFRLMAARVLADAGFAVVAEAGDGASALEAASVHRPAVALVDLNLPDQSGLDVAERLALGPEPLAVVLTPTHDAADFGDRIQRCGARGFIPKAELSGARLMELLAG